MRHLLSAWSTGVVDQYEACLLLASSCHTFLGFLYSGDFTLSSLTMSPAVLVSDAAVDSQSESSALCINLWRAKTNPFGCIYPGRTGIELYPVAAMLNFLAVRPPGKGLLSMQADGTLLLKQ